MAKRLFLLIISSFFGIINAPDILMASDSFVPSGISNVGITETVAIVEEPEFEEIEEDKAEEEYVEPAYVAPVYVEPEYVAPEYVEPVYVAPSNSISIAGRTLEIVDVADTTVNSGDHVNKYGDRFLYGHNTAGVFGGLVNLGTGSTFSVTYGGVTKNYVVAKIVIFEKNVGNGKLQLSGEGSYMRSVANAKSDGIQYDLSLMTCYGTSYGNGDASHRWVIFANAI